MNSGIQSCHSRPFSTGQGAGFRLSEDGAKDGACSGRLPNDQHICEGRDSLPNIAQPWLYPSPLRTAPIAAASECPEQRKRSESSVRRDISPALFP